jgi:hypothetical protein
VLGTAALGVFLLALLGLAHEPWLLRPPGYPARNFVASGRFVPVNLLAAAGLVAAFRAGDGWLAAPLAVFACVGLAHSVTHLDLLHHYLRVPFVIGFAFYYLDRLAVGGRRPCASALAGGLAGVSLALTGWMLLS